MIVNNAAPVVDAGEDQTANEGSEVSFSGSFTDAGIEDTHTVAWDFGDGTSADTVEASHIYTDDGTHTATFTVTDDDGAVSSKTITVKVNNVAPTVDTETAQTGTEGTEVGFTANFSDPDDDELAMTWDFGDGSEPVTTDYPAGADNAQTDSQFHTWRCINKG